MRHRKSPFVAAAFAAALSGTASADEAREKALEKKVEDLERKLEDLSKRIGDGAAGGGGGGELESRVEELEKLSRKDRDGLFPYWKNGMKLDSADGAFKLSVFGRIQNDWTFWDSQDEVTEELGSTVGGTEFRRARLGVGGTIYKNLAYSAEYDFAGGSASFADVYMDLKDPFSVGPSFRVGHFKEPMSLDELTSSRFSTFVERGLPVALVPARNTGIALHGNVLDKRIAYAAGYFRDANGAGNDIPRDVPKGDDPSKFNANEDADDDNHGEHNVTMRVAGRPWVGEDEGAEFVHLGASASFRNPSDEKVRYASRPETHMGPQFVDTGTISGVDTVTLWGLESALVLGEFSLQGEWINADGDGTDVRDYTRGAPPIVTEDFGFGAQSIQASWFVTGETRGYDAGGARFDRVKVKENFGDGGSGAVEFALRYSKINLNDGPVDGGHLDDWTFGINWYLNPNTRVMLNVIRADRQDLPSINAVVVRFAVDF